MQRTAHRLSVLAVLVATVALALPRVPEALVPVPDDRTGSYGRSALFSDFGILVADTSAASTAGEIHVFTRAGQPTYARSIASPFAGSLLSFGDGLALRGTTLSVGAPRVASSRGAVAVYDFDPLALTATNEREIVTTAVAGDQIGSSVALSPDGLTLVAGAADADGGKGAVHVFASDGAGAWSEHQRIQLADAAGAEHFGTSVAFAGDVLLVGAPYRSTGTVQTYERIEDGSWTPRQTIPNPEPSSTQSFGVSISGDGDRAAVGANIGNGGAVSVLERNEGTWALAQTIVAPAGASNFGLPVALRGATLAIAAFGIPTQLSVAKRFHGAWTVVDRISFSNGVQYIRGLDVDSDQVLIGVPAQFGGTGSAAVYDEATYLDAFLVPKTVRYAPGTTTTFTMTGAVDIGSAPPEALLANSAQVNEVELGLAAFVTKSKGKRFLSQNDAVTVDLRFPRAGSSRGTISIRTSADLSAALAADGLCTIRLQLGTFEVLARAQLEEGSFTLSRTPERLDRPALAVEKASAVRPRSGRTRFAYRARFLTDGAGPAAGPTVAVGFSDVSFPTFGPADFERKKGTWRLRKGVSPVVAVTVDYRKGTVAVSAKDLGSLTPTPGANDVFVRLDGLSVVETIRLAGSPTKLGY